MTQQPLISLAEAKPPYFIGVDIGGTNIKIGLVDDDGRTLSFASIETNEPAGPQQAVERTAETCRTLAVKAGIAFGDVARIGLAAPGTICLQQGKFLQPPNFPHWYGFEVKAALAAAAEHEISFINDANAAAFGEYWVGRGSEYSSLIIFTLGTGVGGGIINEGRLINGINSFGSELGHMIVDSRPDARLCVWGGGRGQLEAYASASAIAQIASERLKAGADSQLAATPDLTSKMIYEAAVNGDEFALAIVDETAFFMGIGVASAVHAIDPGLVVLGGAMNFGGGDCPVGKRFLAGIEAEFKSRTFPNVAEGTKIDFATLGGDAGYIGAAGIAQQDHRSGQP